MPSPTPNSPTQRGVNNVAIETGQIINVDVEHWTVDVRTKHTHRLLLDLQVGAPYLHFNSGEGIYAMPEVGALVKACMPSDDVPFVLCFVTAFEREIPGGVSTQSEEPASGLDDADGEADEAEVTFRAGRPKLQQGDIMLRTRDGNHVWLRRGGVVEIGAGHMAKRVYIPITNMLRDVFENYEALSTAGEMMWTTTRSDSDPSGEAQALFTLATRDHAQDENTTVLVQLGHVDDDIRVRCVVAPDAIDSRTGEVTGSAAYEYTINSDGDVEASIAGDVEISMSQDLNVTVSGDGDLTFGNLTETVNGDLTQRVSGSHDLQAASSRERLSGTKVIDAPLTQIGGSGASKQVLMMTASMIAFFNHTHDILGSTTGPPSTIPNVNDVGSRKLKTG